MKKILALIVCVAMVFVCAALAEDVRVAASYEYNLADGEERYVENLIFSGDVVIAGENANIVFANCEIKGNVVLKAAEGTKVMLMGCDVLGECIIENEVTGAGLDYNNPKFLADGPVSVRCDGGAGSVIALGDFEVTFNGVTYTMADSELFIDAANPEAGLVPYEGQEASYFIVCRYSEGGEAKITVVSEYEG